MAVPSLYESMFIAERAWQAKLDAAFPRASVMQENPRYTVDGVSTPELKAARNAYVKAHTAYFQHQREMN